MKRASKPEGGDELRPDYDLKELLKGGVRGKYVERYRAGTNLVLLEPDVAQKFRDGEAVNDALRLVIELTKIPNGKRRSSAPRRARPR
jgi:hypothetical protein